MNTAQVQAQERHDRAAKKRATAGDRLTAILLEVGEIRAKVADHIRTDAIGEAPYTDRARKSDHEKQVACGLRADDTAREIEVLDAALVDLARDVHLQEWMALPDSMCKYAADMTSALAEFAQAWSATGARFHALQNTFEAHGREHMRYIQLGRSLGEDIETLPIEAANPIKWEAVCQQIEYQTRAGGDGWKALPVDDLTFDPTGGK